VFTRYVALGDSNSEGLQDPYPDGRGYRGWPDRLAERIAAERPGLLYANLAVRGKLTRHVRHEQLDAALALEPELVTLAAGLNDVLRRNCSIEAVAGSLEEIYAALRGAGATVATYTYPDPVPVNPLARPARPRLRALNAAIRESAARHGVVVAELEGHPVASDPRLWHADRLHANAEGHRRIAAAMAEALGLAGPGEAWHAPLPPAGRTAPHSSAAGHAAWACRHLAPWVVRRLRGRSSGDGLTCKRPALEPFESFTDAR
jgi:lysophospholipase L1-like esterase